jgi:hypothetical protein
VKLKRLETKQTPWLLICKRTIPEERPPRPVKLCRLLRVEGAVWSVQRILIRFSRPDQLLLFQVAPHLSS